MLGQKLPRTPLAERLNGTRGSRLLWLVAFGTLAFGVAEMPALVAMSSHGTGVLGFEFAGSEHRLRQILTRWGGAGREGAQQHIIIDLGFIACYGTLLTGLCERLASRFAQQGRAGVATAAAGLAWLAIVAASVNVAQKLMLWMELHGHESQPLPALSAMCGAVTLSFAIPAAVFAASGDLLLRRRRAPTDEGQAS